MGRRHRLGRRHRPRWRLCKTARLCTKHCILQCSGWVGGIGFAGVQVRLQLLHETLYFTMFWGDVGAASGRPRGDLGAASGRPRDGLAGAEVKQQVLHETLCFTVFCEPQKPGLRVPPYLGDT